MPDEALVDRLLRSDHESRRAILASDSQVRTVQFVKTLRAPAKQSTQGETLRLEILEALVESGSDAWFTIELVSARLDAFVHAQARDDLAAANEHLNRVIYLGHERKEPRAIGWGALNATSLALGAGDVALAVHHAHTLVTALEQPSADGGIPQLSLEAVSTVLENVADRAYYKLADYTAAERFAEHADRSHPNVGALVILGNTLGRRGEHSRAREVWSRLNSLNLKLGFIPFNLAGCEIVLGNKEAALSAMRRACDLSPDDLSYKLSFARLHYDLERWTEAVDLADSLLEACATVSDGDRDLSVIIFGHGTKSLPELVTWTRGWRLQCLAKLKRFDRVRSEFDILIETDPERRYGTLVARAGFHWDAGDLESALRDLATAESEEPARSLAFLARAEILFNADRTDAALVDLGILIRRLEDPKAAVPLLEQIVAANPDLLEAKKWLGCAYTFTALDDLARGIRELTELFGRGCFDAYAFYRIGLARITVSMPGESLPVSAIVAGLSDLSLAVMYGRDDNEIVDGYRWLLDRVIVVPMVRRYLEAAPNMGTALAMIAPALGVAMRGMADAMTLSDAGKHQEAIDLLLPNQERLFEAGLPLCATRMHLQIADNLIRMGRLQAALDRLDAFHVSHMVLVARPLTERLRARAERGLSLKGLEAPVLYLETEYSTIGLIGYEAIARAQEVLFATARWHLGDREGALNAIGKAEQELLAEANPGFTPLDSAVQVVHLLHETGEFERATVLAEQVLPRVEGRNALELEFIAATILLRDEYQQIEAAAAFERLLPRANELGAEGAARVILDLATHAVTFDPRSALNLVSGYVGMHATLPRVAARASHLAARAAESLDDLTAARDHVLRALAVIDRLRSDLLSHADRIALVGQQDRLVDDAMRILIGCSDAAGVLDLIEKTRARAFVDQLALGQGPAALEPNDVEGERTRLERILTALATLQEGIQKLGANYIDQHALRELGELAPELEVMDRASNTPKLSIPVLAERSNVVVHRLARVRDDVDRRLLAALGEKARPKSTSQIREALLAARTNDHDCMLATFVVSEQSMFVVLLGTALDGPRLIKPAVDATAFADLAYRLRTQVRAIRVADLEDALAPLIAPIADATKPGDVVILAPPANLAHVPFHVAPFQGQPIVERNPICYVPSGTVLVECLQRRIRATGGSLVVGDPRANLPKARDEARAIAARLGVMPLLDDASPASVLEHLSRGETDLVHFACHAEFDRADGMASALLLASRGLGDDGRLTARSLSTVQLDGARIVLSACDTGLGEIRPGSEAFGLPRALLSAGARTVVVSLWKANDLASYLLMQAFYRERQEHGTATALAVAQKWLRSQTVSDALRWCDERLADATDPAERVRVSIDRADLTVVAEDFAAARIEYETVLATAHAAEFELGVARAKRALDQLAARGNLPSDPNYLRRPFAGVWAWAPFVTIGDWR